MSEKPHNSQAAHGRAEAENRIIRIQKQMKPKAQRMQNILTFLFFHVNGNHFLNRGKKKKKKNLACCMKPFNLICNYS